MTEYSRTTNLLVSRQLRQITDKRLEPLELSFIEIANPREGVRLYWNLISIIMSVLSVNRDSWELLQDRAHYHGMHGGKVTIYVEKCPGILPALAVFQDSPPPLEEFERVGELADRPW